jgi:hypothetical protein
MTRFTRPLTCPHSFTPPFPIHAPPALTNTPSPRILHATHPQFRYLGSIQMYRRLLWASGSSSFWSMESLGWLSSLVFRVEDKECGPRAPNAVEYATALVVRGPISYVMLLVLASAFVSSFLLSYDPKCLQTRPKSSCLQTLSSSVHLSIHLFSFCMRISSCDAGSGLLYSLNKLEPVSEFCVVR